MYYVIVNTKTSRFLSVDIGDRKYYTDFLQFAKIYLDREYAETITNTNEQVRPIEHFLEGLDSSNKRQTSDKF